mgnify:CR=1 FL=1
MVRKLVPQRGKVGQPLVPFELDANGAFSIGLKVGRRSGDLMLLDLAGNVRTAALPASTTSSVDRTAPTLVSLTTATASLTNASTVTYTILFSEPVNGLASNTTHFTLTGSGCQLGALNGGPTTYSIAITGCANTSSTQLSLKNGTVTDLAGNSGVANANSHVSPLISIDRIAADVTLTPSTVATSTGVITYLVEFNEPVTGLTANDFAQSGSAAIDPLVLTTISSTRYELEVLATSSGDVSIGLADGSVCSVALTIVAGE